MRNILNNCNKVLFLVFSILFFTTSIMAEYNFGDGKSSTLSTKAWAALEVRDWKAVEAYTEKCISMYSKQALKHQSSLTEMPPASVAFNYWALNDVGTCYFIKARAYKERGMFDKAKDVCNLVIEEYNYSQCWDPQGWFWSIADACKDLISMLGTNIDFEDYTSETLTRKAWESLGAGNHNNTVIYAEKCITLYTKDAIKHQESLSNYAPKEKAFNYWALNDVGTCYFILGETYAANEKWQEAVDSYRKLVEEFFYSQCWDPRGWFWKPAVASRGKLNKIRAEQGIA